MKCGRRTNVAAGLALAGSLSLVVIGDPRAHAAAAVAVLLAWGVGVVVALRGTITDSPGAPLTAALVRLPLLFVAPTLSDDVHRYVWEGQVLAEGMSPFAHAPNDPLLTTIRDANWALVNHREVSSIYPPAAMLLFLLLSPGGVVAWRIAMAAADVATAWALGRRSPRAAWTWALLPLPAIESAVSGHLEGVGVLCLVLALGGSNAAAWLGAMVKLLPGVLLLRSGWRGWLGWGGATALALAAFIGPGIGRGMGTYASNWSYNGSIWPALTLFLSPDLARLACGIGAACIVIGIVFRTTDRGRIALWTTGAFVCLSPTVHPWYALWALAAGLWTGTRAWTLLAVTLPLSYIVLAGYDAEASAWTEPTWTQFVIYLPFYGMLLADAKR